MKDKFGNVISIGDYVIFILDLDGEFVRGKVKEIKGNNLLVTITDGDIERDCYAYAGCFVKDNSDILKTYADSYFFLLCLKSCGVDNWDGYGLVQEMYYGNEE